MTDVHTHILFGVDDGAKTLGQALDLVRREAEEGVTDVVCTPHQGAELLRPALLRERFAALCEAAGCGVRLHLGAEIYYFRGMTAALGRGDLLTMGGGRHVLVEFSDRFETENIPDAVYELSVAGYIPVVAHAERYFYLDRRGYAAVCENGGKLQVNARAFTRRWQRGLLRFLLKEGLVSYIASDCHDPVVRTADFAAAKKYVRAKFPAQEAALFGSEAGADILL